MRAYDQPLRAEGELEDYRIRRRGVVRQRRHQCQHRLVLARAGRVIANRDIWRPTDVLMREHSDDAELIAAQRADVLLARASWRARASSRLCSTRLRNCGANRPKTTSASTDRVPSQSLQRKAPPRLVRRGSFQLRPDESGLEHDARPGILRAGKRKASSKQASCCFPFFDWGSVEVK